MDWRGEKDAFGKAGSGDRTGPVGTRFGPVVPKVLPGRPFESILSA